MNSLQSVPEELQAENLTSSELLNQATPSHQLLRQVLQSTAVSLLLAILLFLLRDSFTIKDVVVSLIYGTVIVSGFGLLYIDKLTWLAHGFIIFFWLSLTILMVFYGSSRVPSPGSYTIVILITALLLRGRATFFYTLISLISGILLSVATQVEYIPLFPLNQDTSIHILATMPQAFVIFSLFGITYHSLRYTLHTLRFNEYDLKQIRETLGQRTAALSATNIQLRQEIEEREQIEAKLEQQRSFLREIIDTIPNYIFVKDKDSRFLMINKALASAYNTTPKEIEGRTGRDFTPHIEEISQFEEGDRAVLAACKEMVWPELPFTDLEGNHHWLHVVKRPLYDPATDTTNVLGITNDITLVKATTEALKEKEENFRTLVEASFEGIIICVEHVVQEANANFATMFGYTAVSEILGHHASEFINVEDNESLVEKLAAHTRLNMEATGIRKDGTTFPLELASHSINYQGQKAQITGYRDITNRKQAEEAEQQANKLESLRIMAGGLAHDFNNLLVAMMGQIAIAKTKINEEHICHNNLDKAVQATETAALLTRQLLAYTGEGHFEVAPVHLNDLINQNLRLFQDALPVNIHFQTDLGDPLPHIMADSGQIQQIIMNLLLNAAEALGTQPGTISITTTPCQLTEAQVKVWKPNNQEISPGSFVLLEVSDNGRGMNEETLNRIFDPFFSTKGTGRGLGLAAVLGIVKGHNGSVYATSKVGQGTTFRFLFPFEESETLQTIISEHSAPEETKNHVLVIDDERPVREALVDILALKQIPVVLAENGPEGINRYREQISEIGLIILDLSMPGMGGFEVFKTLKEIDPSVKIILSSGFTEGEILRKMHGMRPISFLQKPYRLDTVLTTVEKHLGLTT